MADHPDFEEMVKAVGRWRDPIAYSATVYTPAYDRRWGLERSIREILTAAGVPELLAERDRRTAQLRTAEQECYRLREGLDAAEAEQDRLREAWASVDWSDRTACGSDDPRDSCGEGCTCGWSLVMERLAENSDGR